MGTVTVGTPITRVKCGNKWQIVARITMSSSYATGGDTIDPNKLGIGKIDAMSTTPFPATASAAVHCEIDPTVAANKVKAYLQAGGQVANATDLSTFSALCLIIGC